MEPGAGYELMISGFLVIFAPIAKCFPVNHADRSSMAAVAAFYRVAIPQKTGAA